MRTRSVDSVGGYPVVFAPWYWRYTVSKSPGYVFISDTAVELIHAVENAGPNTKWIIVYKDPPVFIQKIIRLFGGLGERLHASRENRVP